MPSQAAGVCLDVCQALLGATGKPQRPRTPPAHQLCCRCFVLLMGTSPVPVCYTASSPTTRPAHHPLKYTDANTWRKRAKIQTDPSLLYSRATIPVGKSAAWELVMCLHERNRNFCVPAIGNLLPLPMPTGRDALGKRHYLSLALQRGRDRS